LRQGVGGSLQPRGQTLGQHAPHTAARAFDTVVGSEVAASAETALYSSYAPNFGLATLRASAH